MSLNTREMLLLYTDGLTTARWRDGGRVGEERLAAWLLEPLPAVSGRAA